jgi:hypothetical protein
MNDSRAVSCAVLEMSPSSVIPGHRRRFLLDCETEFQFHVLEKMALIGAFRRFFSEIGHTRER